MAVWIYVLAVSVCMFTVCEGAEYTYYYKIDEELPPAHATFIGNIANDTNLKALVSEDDLSTLQYSFLTDGNSETLRHFDLDENTGDLRTASNEVLDREVLCPFKLQCVFQVEVAIKSTINQFFRTVDLEISVKDINDNAPEFRNSKTTLNISEGVTVGAPFSLEGAVDADTGGNNSLQTYSIIPADGPFGIQFTKNIDGTSYLNLIVNEKLNHEEENSYSLQIIAKDGGSPPKEGVLLVSVNVIDMNDNRPKFTNSSYSVTVDEKVGPDTVILAVTATDEDSGLNGELRYSLSSHQSAKNLKLFSINAETGDLKVVGDLQNEAEPKYDIIVEVSDKGLQAFTTQTVVTVHIQDTINSPPRLRVHLLSSQFLNFSTISEYANLGVVVAHIRVEESDRGRNGIVQCELLQHEFFELQGFDVNEYKVIVAKPLDRESMPQHTLTVVCEDAGTPPLSVNATFIVKVTDKNDNAPKFTLPVYSATIEENNKIRASVLQVLAEDPDEGDNGKVRYSIHSDKDDFIISSTDGVILANTQFDFETRPVINFTVIATDMGEPSKSSVVQVTVKVQDRNDEKPKFSHSVFQFNVSESARPGQMIGQIVAYDFETGLNGQVYISLSRDIKDISPFVLFPNGSVMLNGTLDYETTKQYEFIAKATDKGTPALSSTTYVRILVRDENDNPPVIRFPNTTHHTANVSTDFIIGDVVTIVNAADADTGRNSELSYIITSRNDSSRFEIDMKTGNILVSKDLSAKDVNIYKLMIMVQDGGTPPFPSHSVLIVNVVPGNGSSRGMPTPSDQNILITVTIICVTAVVSAIIVLVIIVMRRRDNQQRKVPEGSMYLQNPKSLPQFVDKIKVDNVRPQKGTENGADEEFGFSNKKRDVSDNRKNEEISKKFNVSKEVKDEKDSSMDQVTVLQLHQALLQSYQDNQLTHAQKVAAWQRGQDDVHSDASGETTTSDSGRGGSEEDICSHSGISASQIEDLHELSRDTLMNNTSFQSSQTVPSSLKTGVKENMRTSVRKHVTFRDLSDKGHHPQHATLVHPSSKHQPKKHEDRKYPQNPPPKPAPRVPQPCGFTVRNPTFANNSDFHYGGAKNPVDFHLPVPDSGPHMRDWRNDSIATTDDGDDRSTTTSGSYTIDNEDNCITLDYNNFKDVVV